jgi:hypothetical protein
LVGLVSGIAVLLVTALTPAASAGEDRQDVVRIRNLHYGECLTYRPGEAVTLGPCGSTPFTLWNANVGYVTEIRSAVTGECLESIDTSNEWDDVGMHPCSGDARQLWGVPYESGLIQNLATGKYLKANHQRVVYAGDFDHYYPYWAIDY